MRHQVYRYQFKSSVEPADVEATILLAVLACESLHGEAQVRLDARHLFDADQRVCIIDASTPVGGDFNKLFCNYLRREIEPSDFSVERVETSQKENEEVTA